MTATVPQCSTLSGSSFFLVREIFVITLIVLSQLSKIPLNSVIAVWKVRRNLDID